MSLVKSYLKYKEHVQKELDEAKEDAKQKHTPVMRKNHDEN